MRQRQEKLARLLLVVTYIWTHDLANRHIHSGVDT